MPSDRTVDALRDMAEHFDLAIGFTATMDLATFEADTRTRLAVTRCLEIISEASRRVPAEMQARHPAIPWRQIAAAGNIYRHEYGAVRPEMLWRTVRDALPALREAVAAELDP